LAEAKNDHTRSNNPAGINPGRHIKKMATELHLQMGRIRLQQNRVRETDHKAPRRRDPMMWQHNGTSINKRRNVIFGYTIYDFIVECKLCEWHNKYPTLAIARESCIRHATLHIMSQEPLPIRNPA
jgi:hypothetical protein